MKRRKVTGKISNSKGKDIVYYIFNNQLTHSDLNDMERSTEKTAL